MDADYYHVKNDILARTMSFSTDPNSMAGLVTVPVQRVIELMKLNARGVKPERLEGKEGVSRVEAEPGFVNVIGEDSITRFDNAGRKGRGGNRRDRDRRSGAEQGGRDGRQAGKGKNSNVSQTVTENAEQPRENGNERREAGNRRRDDRRRSGDSRKGDRQRQDGDQRQQRVQQDTSRIGAEVPKRQRTEQFMQEGQGRAERGDGQERSGRRDQQRRRDNGQSREPREGRENSQQVEQRSNRQRGGRNGGNRRDGQERRSAQASKNEE